MVPAVLELVSVHLNTLKKRNIVKKINLMRNENAFIQAKVELGTLEIEVNALKLNIEEQKKLLHKVNHDKEVITADNLSMKKEINLLKSQIMEQQEVTLKSKIEILKITEDKEKIQKEFDVLNTVQIADHNKMAEKINH